MERRPIPRDRSRAIALVVEPRPALLPVPRVRPRALSAELLRRLRDEANTRPDLLARFLRALRRPRR